jgi:hypothetical protein
MTPDDETGHAQKISQFFQLQERFDEDPSIENYVALRRFAPGCDTEIYRFAGVDPLRSLESDLKKFGLDPVLICGVLDGDDREMDELCLQLLERLIERKRLVAEGMTQLQSRCKGVSDALIDHLIVVMLEAMQQNGVDPRPSFVLLVRERLGGANTDIFKSHKKRESQDQAIFLGFQLRRRGAQPTIRRVADILGVQPSTVNRWFPEGDFLERVEEFSRPFEKIKHKLRSKT